MSLTSDTTTPATQSPPRVEDVVGRQIARLQGEYTRPGAQPTAWAAATMAALRRATPGQIDENPATWEIVYSALPEELIGRGEAMSRAERAAHAALVLYAVHQSSQPRPLHQRGIRLGQALRRLPDAIDEKSPILRRFNSLISASTFEATMYHLRSLMTLLRREGIALDHARLCRDLFSLQDPRTAPAVRRQWGRDYFGSRGVSDATAEADDRAEEAGRSALRHQDTPSRTTG